MFGIIIDIIKFDKLTITYNKHDRLSLSLSLSLAL